MKVTLAKTAGFCFGVSRAMDMAIEAAEKEGGVVTLGPLIHNSSAVAYLAEKGVEKAESIAELKGDKTVIIRSHGVGE
ncbi:MAG: bifunctional 4-hydroxy-3-methylbut-2-enyl diphosphate reductase/30S ribosomal protein S1, partial [Oscillospiraceae bacterium]|nr:bifunctional 4-hydroxy-3-methylbut-2-enyl diphosphate reductase/30S ribosomal protein S1 [Oscillospiraceae bacterium]